MKGRQPDRNQVQYGMKGLKKLQRNWEGLARVDPLWAICVDDKRLGNRWSQEEFFETGELEISRVMEYLGSLSLLPDSSGAALDFGCGVGRLTRALGRRFNQCWGIDISPTMIELAGKLNRNACNCHFYLNPREYLGRFADESFVFIYSSIVLQHIKRSFATQYIREMVRLFTPGGILVFQVPEREREPVLAKLRHRVGFRRNLNNLLRRQTVHAFHMEMHCLPERDIRALLAADPVRIVDVQLTNSSTSGFCGNLVFLDREPEHGFISKQYCIVKNRPKLVRTIVDQDATQEIAL